MPTYDHVRDQEPPDAYFDDPPMSRRVECCWVYTQQPSTPYREEQPVGNYIDPTDPLADDVETFDADDGPNESVCAEHPDATVTDVQSFIGYAGGRSYVYTLSCGCSTLDESDDVRAAM